MTQTTRMVAVAVGDEDVVHRPEVNTHSPRIADEHIAGSRVKKDAVSLCFQ